MTVPDNVRADTCRAMGMTDRTGPDGPPEREKSHKPSKTRLEQLSGAFAMAKNQNESLKMLIDCD